MDKDIIRSRVRASKALLTDADRRNAAAQVWQMLESTAAFMVANHILIYHSLADELDTRDFLGRWHTRKRFYLPRVNGINLDILPFDPATLTQGAFHIMEPSGGDTVPLDNIELVIVPAIAYDRHGNRVGRGKGFYDRLLADTRATKVGVAYDCQFFEEIDAEEHDVPVDIVITDRRMHTIRRQKRR